MPDSQTILQPTPPELLLLNERWVDEINKKYPGFFSDLAKGQKPKVLWIGCADSRVPESVITDVLPGAIFTTRNIANQLLFNDDSANSVLAYAVDVVGVQHVIVAGHSKCGGVKSALKEAIRPGSVKPLADGSPLRRFLGPLIALAKAFIDTESYKDLTREQLTDQLQTLVERLAQLNVLEQVKNVCNSPTIRNSQREIAVHGWVFDLSTGKLEVLHVTKCQ